MEKKKEMKILIMRIGIQTSCQTISLNTLNTKAIVIA